MTDNMYKNPNFDGNGRVPGDTNTATVPAKNPNFGGDGKVGGETGKAMNNKVWNPNFPK